MNEPAKRLEVDIEMQLRGALAERVLREAKARGVEPAALMADLIEMIVKDELFSAILD